MERCEHCYGRETVLEQLTSAYRYAAAGAPQFVVLRGMTGIGKTRLAQELYRSLRRMQEPAYWPDAFCDDASKDDVNPRFAAREQPPEIPFLWWGLQFKENDQTSAASLLHALPDLVPHAGRVVARRRIKALESERRWALLNAIATGIGFLPAGALAAIPGLGKSWSDVRRNQDEQRALEQRLDESIAENQRREQQERADFVLDTLRLFLDPEQADAPTVPVVLLLDDAHWMDAPTLSIVHTLWHEARQAGWPLLILATHWDDEWSLQREQPSDPPRLAHGFEGTLIDVAGVEVEALGLWLERALPGLSDDDRTVLLDKATTLCLDHQGSPIDGGSPRVLEQLIEWLLEDPAESFESGDPTGPLRVGITEEIKSRIRDLRAIVAQRFARMSPAERKAVGWSAEQGPRFLVELTSAVARDLDRFDDPTIRAAIVRAESPRHWIIRSRQHPNLCEFRSTLFFEVAREHYTKRPQERNAVADATRRVLLGWLDSGRLDPAGDAALPFVERREALLIAQRLFRSQPRVDEPNRGYANALARLVQCLAHGYRWGESSDWTQAELVAIEFADQPSLLSIVDGYWQVEVIDVLIQTRELERARRLLESLKGQMTTMPVDPRRRLLVAERHGTVLEHLGNRREALDAFREGLGMSRAIVRDFGRSPEALRDLMVSHHRLAIDAASRSNSASACEELAACRSLLDEIEHSGWADVRTPLDRQAIEQLQRQLECPP